MLQGPIPIKKEVAPAHEQEKIPEKKKKNLKAGKTEGIVRNGGETARALSTRRKRATSSEKRMWEGADNGFDHIKDRKPTRERAGPKLIESMSLRSTS